jgi:hypothetical protein
MDECTVLIHVDTSTVCCVNPNHFYCLSNSVPACSEWQTNTKLSRAPANDIVELTALGNSVYQYMKVRYVQLSPFLYLRTCLHVHVSSMHRYCIDCPIP